MSTHGRVTNLDVDTKDNTKSARGTPADAGLFVVQNINKPNRLDADKNTPIMRSMNKSLILRLPGHLQKLSHPKIVLPPSKKQGQIRLATDRFQRPCSKRIHYRIVLLSCLELNNIRRELCRHLGINQGPNNQFLHLRIHLQAFSVARSAVLVLNQ